MLDLFENLGPQGNWRLDIPRSANNLDYEAISDIKLALYFDAEVSDSLREHLRTFYPQDGGRSVILSARFHFPDEFFRLDADRRVRFTLHPARFPFNYDNCRLQGLAIRVIPVPPTSAQGLEVTVTRMSDGTSVHEATDAKGAIQGAPGTMQPFDAWKDASPMDTFTVQLGDGVDLSSVADIQLAIDYGFTYRADGSVAA
jgi:hypothetical protein